MKNQDIIFGTRPVLEAIKSGKTIEKIFIQKNLSKELFDEIKSNLAGKNVNISAVPKEKLNRIIFSGESLISSAFNRVAEPYSNYVNEQDTRERIILLIVKDIQRQLILFKNKKKYNEG